MPQPTRNENVICSKIKLLWSSHRNRENAVGGREQPEDLVFIEVPFQVIGEMVGYSQM